MCSCNLSSPAKRAREIRAYTAYLHAVRQLGDRSFIDKNEKLSLDEINLERNIEIELVEDILRQLNHEN
ncbi:MAG: hypothetical protein PF694_09125 [Bacteroidetes bacterium]|jgi:hypothetical protein|nr:hypothetical protein [Bacteroidota bacterium]